MQEESPRKFKAYEFKGKVVREDDRYLLQDNSFLENLVLSHTTLKPGQATKGHSHAEQEEVYIFLAGHGVMKIDDTFHAVEMDSVVQIKKGEFHQVINASEEEPLLFLAIFEKYEGRG